jgi:hypothetical protein
MSHDIATRKNDTVALKVLSDLREELDELEEFRMEDLTGLTKEQRRKFAYPESETDESMEFLGDSQGTNLDITDSEDEEGDEDEDAVAAAENEMEVAAEMFEDKAAVAAVENGIGVAETAPIIILPSRPKSVKRS